MYSAPSVVISTLENGKPSSAPQSLRAAAPDSSRVAISWEPGPFPNGPLISYVLRLTDTQPNTIDALEVSTQYAIDSTPLSSDSEKRQAQLGAAVAARGRARLQPRGHFVGARALP